MWAVAHGAGLLGREVGLASEGSYRVIFVLVSHCLEEQTNRCCLLDVNLAAS